MRKYFNTAGPCQSGKHYMLPPEDRLTELRPLIEEEAYFVVHAPRQTGKTTSLEKLAWSLTAEGKYAAVLASCKAGESAGRDLEAGIHSVIGSIRHETRQQLPKELRPRESFSDEIPTLQLLRYLSAWSERCPRPVVLFLDKIDALVDETLLSLLDQLHTGYRTRPEYFPHSMALIGLRDVRDYEIRVDGKPRLGSSSPFNIKTASLLMPNFTANEISELYAQHTAETAQSWSAEAITTVYDLTRGQPWLVNALARQIVNHEAPDRTTEIDVGHVDAAKEALILRRDTHLDSLIQRLREDRVRRVIDAVLAGEHLTLDVLNDDVAFAKDLGLVNSGMQGLEIANPIYCEIVPRALTSLMEETLVLPHPSYVDDRGVLDFERLMDDFSTFWIENAETYLERAPYSEAAAQLVFMAFLHKITNGKGGGLVDREYAAGRGRLDICVRWPLPAGGYERWALELKVWRDTTPTGKGILTPPEKGMVQLTEYLERLGMDRGYLVVFDARSDAEPLPDRIAREELEYEGRTIIFWTL